MRLEIQCKPDKIKHLKNKYGLSDTSPMNLLRTEIATDVVSYYFTGVVGDSDFYSFAKAKVIILNSTYNEGIKKKLILFLKLIANSNSIEQAKRKFVTGQGYVMYRNVKTLLKGHMNTFREHLKRLDAIGVNPVTIPRDWNIDYLENPIRSIKDMTLDCSLPVAK